ncbi:malate dehydrogenase [Mycobacteroides abscessus subsp. abscessus]|nr:malate dehydrogenase [Mycobacteroides abscessus subsp. abscessus]
MFAAAANAVAEKSDSSTPGASLLPAITKLADVSRHVAIEVAKAAVQEGIAKAEIDDIEQAVDDAMWKPEYKQIKSK